MSDSTKPLQSGDSIGGYRLVRSLSHSPTKEVWLGLGRTNRVPLEITVLRADERSEFLADAHAKARVTHAAFLSVGEPVDEADLAYYAGEALLGQSVAEMSKQSETLRPNEMSLLLHEIAVALQSLKQEKVFYPSLRPDDILYTRGKPVRLRNRVTAREPKFDRLARAELVDVFRRLLQPGLPGSTRLSGLFDLMEGSPIRPSISFKEIEGLTARINGELASDHLTAAVARPINEGKQKRLNVLFAALFVVLLGVLSVAFVFRDEMVEPETEGVLLIPAGTYSAPDGQMREVPAFNIADAEVTVADYATFLGAWAMMTDEEKMKILPIDSLGEAWSPRPREWATYYPIALAGEEWEGRRYTVDCPVTAVDWWQATSYALWKKGRLPTRQEWWAAASTLPAGTEHPTRWGPTGGPGPGPHGMGGNVAEWARGRSRNPDYPQLAANFAVLGGSFESQEGTPYQVQWVDSPSFSHSSVGFRLVYDVEQ